MIKITDANLDEINFTVDDNDQVSNVEDKRSLDTTYVFNGFGDVIRRTSPDTGITDYEYDAAGNMTKQTDARSVITNFTYDNIGRVTAKSFPGSASENVTYSYDDTTGGNYGVGQLTSFTDETGSTSVVYDMYGNGVQETRVIGSQSYVTSYNYDEDDNIVGMTYPSGRTVTYVRDALGRVASVWTQKSVSNAPVVVASNITYGPYGPIKSMLLGNGLSVSMTRDQDYRLTRLYVTDGTSDIQDLSYGYGDINGDAGNITSITDALDSSLDQSFTFDSIYRMTQAVGVYGTIDYAYDANENRTSRTITSGSTITETSTIDPYSNRLLSINDGSTTRSFTYTSNGNITTDSTGSGLDYIYNHANRVSEVEENSVLLVTYAYNDLGQRVVKDLGGGDVTHYHYDLNGVLIAKSDATAVVETEYVTLFGFPLAVIETTGGTGTPTEQTIDNDDTEASSTGDWSVDTVGTGYEGSDYESFFGGTGTNNFTWTPTISSSNQYQVYAKWPDGLVDTGLANYSVTHAGGTSEVTLDQTRNGGDWQLLGAYPMDPSSGHSVALNDAASAIDSQSEIIIDNTDSNVEAVGSWFSTTQSNTYGNINTTKFRGSDYFRHNSGGVGDDYFRWKLDPVLKLDGKYKVYVRWARYGSHATNAEYTVNHDGGSSSFAVNQQHDGGNWNLLGAFDFTAGEEQYIELADIGDTTFVAADSVRLVRDLDWQDGDEITIDNDAATLTGTGWITKSSYGEEAMGGNYYINLQHYAVPPASISWQPTFSRSGRYTVYARWPRYSTASYNAYFTVHHAGGSTKVLVNQRQYSPGRWIPLGSYNMNVSSNHRVELEETKLEYGSNYVIGDAVKFVREDNPTLEQTVPPIVVDNADTNTSSTGSWNTYNPSNAVYWWANYLRETSLTNPPVTFTWTPVIPKSGEYRVYARWRPHSSNSTAVNYTVHHSGGSSTVSVDQQTEGGWVLLGSYSLAPSSNHRIVLDDIGANGYVVADAVKLELVDAIPGAFIADNAEGTATGTGWVSSTGLGDGYFWGDDYQYVPETDPTATFTWEPTIPEARLYRLSAWWQGNYGDQASSVKYTVHHAGGTTDVYRNQQGNYSSWMSLGEFVMEPGQGHKIVLSNDSLDGDMSADAIRFEVIDDLPSVFADAIKLVSNDGEDVNYVHADHLGAPQKMTDADRSLVWDASFLPFGEEDSLIGSAANDNRFPGQRLEAETGLHYNYFRDYDPTTGRYLQSDPIGLAGGINTYGYVSGNPVMYTDPTGEFACGGVCIALVGAAVGVGIDYLLELHENNWEPKCVNLFEFAKEEAPWLLLPVAAKGVKYAKTFWKGVKGGDKIVHIGKVDDLKNVPRNQTLLDELPDLGTPKANWKQNSSVLRRKIREGYEIRDASKHRLNSDPDPTPLRPDRTVRQSFLGAERNLLNNLGVTPK